MKIEINLNNNKAIVKENNNLVVALREFDMKEVKSVIYTEGDITTFAKSVKTDKGYVLKITGRYNNRTGEFEYV